LSNGKQPSIKIAIKSDVLNKQNIIMHKKIKISKNFYEKLHWPKNELICGLDEVGRGCLAGPLVVAAVILKPNTKIKGLKDSKLMSKEELLEIYPKIIKNSWYSFGILNNIDIDRYNIWQSTLIAMKQATMNLLATCPKLPSVIVIDAMPLSLANSGYSNLEINYFNKGESLSCSIAAASVIAKVKRDSLMAKYDEFTPGYNFAKHKGYGTKDHQTNIAKNKDSILHRQTFLKKFQHLLHPQETQVNIFDNLILEKGIESEFDEQI